MKIKWVIITNFKSYKGTHRLGPFTDLTAVIGPNGSGKSNAFEAICFVLGANASILRCPRLETLICSFSDEDNRKCSVQMVLLQNMNEIILKRDISGSGSNYWYNNIRVTSDEYKQVLINLGFPTRFQSFVIFQGDIQSMASMKPMDLTKLIEEVSRSCEYKEDYQKAIEHQERCGKQLIEAEKDKELFSERKRSVKEEVQRTEKWLTKEMEVQNLESLKNDFKIFQLKLDRDESSNEISTLQTSLEEIQAKINELNEAISSSDSSISEAQNSVQSAQKKLKKLISNSEKAKTTFSTHNSDFDALIQRKQRLNTQIVQLQSTASSEKKEIQKLNREINKFQKKYHIALENKIILIEINEKIQSLKEIHSKSEKVKMEQQIQDIKKQISLLLEEKKTKQSQMEFIISKSRHSKGRCILNLRYDAEHQLITDKIGEFMEKTKQGNLSL